MANEPGTLGVIAIELAKVIQPLKERVDAGQTLELLAELGIRFPESLGTDPQFKAAMDDASNRIGELPELIKAVIDAVGAEDWEEAAVKSVELTVVIAHLIDDIVNIANVIDAKKGTFPAIDVDAFLADFSGNLLNYLLVNYMESISPALAGVLELLGVVERSEQNVGSTNPVYPPYIKKAVHFSEIINFIKDPAAHFNRLYGWGNDDFNGTDLLAKLNKVMLELGLPVVLDTSSIPHKLNILFFELSAKTDVTPPGLQLLLKHLFKVGGSYSIIRDSWRVEFGLEAEVPLEAGITVDPAGNFNIIPPAAETIEGEVFARWVAGKSTPGEKLVLLNQPGAGRLEIGSFRVEGRLNLKMSGGKATSEIIVEGELKDGSIIIDATEGDGFLAKILPGTKIKADFNLLMGVSSEKGFYIQGSSAIEIRLPVHIDIGPIALEGLTITLKIGQNPDTGFTELPLSLGADIKAALGPLTAVVQNMGLTAKFSFPDDNSGNLGGSTQLDFEFKPPNGVGLSIDAGGLKGAGFLYIDVDKGEYIGALELEFKGTFAFKAIGIINTKMPDGSDGFALLIIITTEFTPIQIGFGFSLNGIGGLLGLNRTVRIDVLREGVKTGALKSVLFPENVVANINRIVSDLKQIFPIEEGHFLIGPMVKIGWGGTILTLEVGLLLDIPRPMFAILGVLKLVLPTEDAAVLKLQVNFLGVVDFENKYISFDASLFDSKLLIFTLTGDMALRINWGDTPMFILSIGGFHPAFHEAPADLQHMTRLTLALLSGDNPRITIQCYFATTSNTIQFGAKAELYAGACGFSIEGYLGFDVLFQFDPFRFIAEIYAGLALKMGSTNLLSIRLRGSLAGPQPWDVQGEASFSILFFEITISFHVTWGDDADKLDKEKEDILELLKEQVNDSRNWKADIPSNNHLHVTVKTIEPPEGQIVIHPFGVLSFNQTLVPLNYTINKFGEKVPLDDDRFSLTDMKSGTFSLSTQTLKDRFAPAQFTEMSDNEKLSTPSFEQMDSGFKLSGTSSLTLPTPVSKSVDYEVAYLKNKEFSFAGIFTIFKNWFTFGVQASAVSNASISWKNNKISNLAPAEILTTKEEYAVASVSDMRLYGSTLKAGSRAEAMQMHDQLIAQTPSLKGKLQVLSTYELNEA